MPVQNEPDAIPQALHDWVQTAAEDEGTSTSAVLCSALTLYLGLSGAARRSVRYVLASGTEEARAALLDRCGRAIAQAGDEVLRAELAARGRAMGLAAEPVGEEEIAREAVALVRKARQVRRRTMERSASAS